jgi:hypothetical protein
VLILLFHSFVIAMGLEGREVGVAVEYLRGLASGSAIHALIKLNHPGTFADKVEEALELKHADRPPPRNRLLHAIAIAKGLHDIACFGCPLGQQVVEPNLLKVVGLEAASK